MRKSKGWDLTSTHSLEGAAAWVRKRKYGGYVVSKRRRKGTTYFEYQIELKESKAA